MAHPESQEAVAADNQSGDPLDAILKFVPGEEPDKQEEEEDAPSDSGDDADTDEAEPDEGDAEDDDGEDDEADEPIEAIKPPVSLNKEQKAAFEQLPPDLQKVWAETEAQRNREVQLKTTEAAEAKRTAITQAQSELAQIQQQYAAELEVFAQAFIPIEPDLGLLATDPQAYAEQVAYSKQQAAQYQYMMQQIGGLREQSQQFTQQQQAHVAQAELAKLAASLPEWNDAAKRAELIPVLTEIGHELGYSDELMAQAGADDIMALKKASEWKSKAEKYDAWQSRKMQNVRAAKALPKVAKPGVTPSGNPSKAARADAAWQRAKVSRSGDDFADFLEAKGIL